MLSFNMTRIVPYLSLVAVLALGCSNAPQIAKNEPKANDGITDALVYLTTLSGMTPKTKCALVVLSDMDACRVTTQVRLNEF